MRKVITFISTAVVVFLELFIGALLFSVVDEAIHDGAAGLVFLIYMVALLILHLFINERISKNPKIDLLRLDIYYVISWLILEFLITKWTLSNNWIAPVTCHDGEWFCGLEFLAVPLFFNCYIVLFVVISIIIALIKKYKKTNKKQNKKGSKKKK